MSNRFGAFVQAVCGIGFGFLKYIDNLNAFLAFSYLLRALSGIADAASWSSVLSILMKLFPSKVARIMAWTETFFGLGFMIGEKFGHSFFANDKRTETTQEQDFSKLWAKI